MSIYSTFSLIGYQDPVYLPGNPGGDEKIFAWRDGRKLDSDNSMRVYRCVTVLIRQTMALTSK